MGGSIYSMSMADKRMIHIKWAETGHKIFLDAPQNGAQF
jgi:hypothetical protein